MTTNALIERLAMLACGAEPVSEECGICWDVDESISHTAVNLMRAEWREHKLDDSDPLGDWAYLGNHWTGTRGRRRRALCRRTVYWLVAKFGYSGDWA